MENNNLPNNKQAKSVDKMLADTTEESAKNSATQILEDANKPNKTRNTRIIAGCVIGVMLLALVGSLVWWYQSSNKTQFSNASTQNLSNTKADEQNNKARKLADYYRSHYKVVIQSYYLKPRNEMTTDEKSEALRRAKLAFDEDLKTTVPSKNAYLTQDYVANTIYDDYQRLLNPVYGGWDEFYKKNEFDNDSRNRILTKSGMKKIFDSNLNNTKGTLGFFNVLGIRKTDDDAMKKLSDEQVKKNSILYVPFIRAKKIPVGKLTGQILCKFDIKNTDNDIIYCEAPFRKIVAAQNKKDKDFIFDSTLGIKYVVNHDKSVSSRRILIDGFGMV